MHAPAPNMAPMKININYNLLARSQPVQISDERGTHMNTGIVDCTSVVSVRLLKIRKISNEISLHYMSLA